MSYRIAIGTKDGNNISEHFGACSIFQILEINQLDDSITFIENRNTEFQAINEGHQEEKIRDKISALEDCQIVLVSQIGGRSEKLLLHNGIVPLKKPGLIKEALPKIIKFYKRQIFVKGD